MPPVIRPATLADLDAVTMYLSGALRGGPPERYRRFLNTTWMDPKPSIGAVLEEDGQIRGFVGTILSDRSGQRFCNLTSIAVDESHRQHALRLFASALADKTVTYTCFSASERVAKILDFFKFKHRASERVVTGPMSGLRGALQRTRIVDDAHELDASLLGEQRQIARDHRAYRCGQFLIESADRRCYVVTLRRGHGVRAFADVLHASDPDLLMHRIPQVQLAAFRAHRTLLLGIDRVWATSRPLLSFVYRGLRPVYVRSPRVSVAEVDALYSELVPMYGSRL